MNEQQGLLPTRASAPLAPGSSGSGGTSGGPPSSRASDWLLHICRTFNFVTALCCVLCALSLAMALVVRADAPEKDLYFHSGQAVRIYGLALAGLLVVVETEWQRFLLLVPLLDSWLGRGIVQVFLAMLTYREAYPRGTTDFHKSLQLYRKAASMSVLVCGLIYILGALTCVGAVKRAHFRQQRQMEKAQAELQAIDRKRRELERLLRSSGAL